MNVNSVTKGLLWCALLAAPTIGCGGEAGSADPSANDGNLVGYLNPSAQSTYWNSTAGQQGTVVSVCWTANAMAGKDEPTGTKLASTFAGITNMKSWVRKAVENSWGRVADIQFVGWDTQCAAAPNNGDSRYVAANFNHIMLAFVEESISLTGDTRWWTDINGASPVIGTMIRINRLSTTEASVQYPALHEFGHALGFGHEQQRKDNWSGTTPLKCIAHNAGEGAETDDYFTGWVDKDSVMCYDSAAPKLSPGDIMGVQKRYGRKGTGSLVGDHGMCAAIAGGSTTDGAQIMGWPCTGNSWHMNFSLPNDGYEHFKSAANSRCLTVQNNAVPNPMVGWGCGNFPNSRLQFGNASSTGAELRSMGNLCLELVGTQVKAQVCNSSSAQRWDVQHANGSIRADQIQYMGSPGKCLTTSTTSGALGEILTVANCSTTDTKQRFAFPGNGRIKMVNNSALCLAQAGGQPVPASPIMLWNGCDAAPLGQNEQFTLHGRVRTMGACLAPAGTGEIGSLIWAQTCNSSATNQEWDYFL